MILYSPAKINIGLRVTEKRGDGFHNLQSVMFPVGLCDLIEIMKEEGLDGKISLTRSGIPAGIPADRDLCFLAFERYTAINPLPPVHLHLHKQIPVGAGLGGGSSNASTTLKGLNMLAEDPLPEEKLRQLAESLGSDCPFFLSRGAMMMEGRGEILAPVDLNLGRMYLVLLHPGIHISTAEAYGQISPARPEKHLGTLIRQPPGKWKGLVKNDFEIPAFQKYPELKEMKEGLYNAGAVYASMSGSGSSLYGFFRKPPALPGELDRLVIWRGDAGASLTGF
ncbi:MAG TPA: 4-(cytidine 5'-diphospho)-2-C-methyl-D-erythritol kinase [Bacteroides sp.]|nr:4-(cytidine 5'-diphospho)-2-C-methyl-D-erythritol kinase [Bacteroides sp.]